MRHIIIITLMAFALCAHAGKTVAAATPDPNSAQEYFQRGNAFYKQCDYAHAMVCYMRAQKSEPLNKDIQHNINITRSKTIDKMPPESNIFFVEWYKALVMTNTIDHWATISIVSLIAALLLFLAYLFVSNITVRKVSFYTCVVLFLSFCFSVFFAWNRKHILNTHDKAIVVKEAVAIKNLPSTKASETAIIHEGTCVRITDKDMKGWFGIRLSDGREGWIRAAYVELI